MTDVAAFIEEELGLDVTEEQRKVLHAMFPPPPPYVPPKQPWHRKAKWWFTRTILRRRHRQSIANFDRVLKETYGPGLRDSINQQNPLMRMIADGGKDASRRAVWSVKADRASGNTPC